MSAADTRWATRDPDAAPYMRKIAARAKVVLGESHDLTQVVIRPVPAHSARFSLPCVVDGVRRGEKVRLFAKIIGSSDHFTAVISQFMKNMYLEKTGAPAMFDVPGSAHGMAKNQYDRLSEFVANGIATSTPLGCHELDSIRAMLVLEFVVGRPFSKVEVTPALADTAFDMMWRMHKAGFHHGDIKLDNLILGPEGTVYLLDPGSFRKAAPPREQRAYDIASMLCALSERMAVDDLLDAGVLKYPAADQQAAVPYIDLSRNRPDFFLPDEVIAPIKARLSAGAASVPSGR
jgi:hypothetical protein